MFSAVKRVRSGVDMNPKAMQSRYLCTYSVYVEHIVELDTVKPFYNESGLKENMFITIGFRETDILW